PAGLEVTLPEPFLLTLRMWTSGAKVAVTSFAELIVTSQTPELTVSQPDQVAAWKPVAGVPVSLTRVPSWRLASQVGSQLIPAGLEVMPPEPFFLTFRVKLGITAKVAVTSLAALIVTSQTPELTASQPDQVAALKPDAGVPVSLTRVPWLKPASQVGSQLIPAGLEVMLPEPFLLTLRMWTSGAKVAVTSFAAFIVTSH